MPLRYLNRGFARNALMPLYADAQAGLVTPLRDGMNLVAKEYVAAQDPEEPGVLILSRIRRRRARAGHGAAGQSVRRGGHGPRAWTARCRCRCEERRERHQAMLRVMRRNSLERWRDRFVADLRHD